MVGGLKVVHNLNNIYMKKNLIFIVLGLACVMVGAFLKITNLTSSILFNGILLIGLLLEIFAVINYLRPKSKQETFR
jgi:hypothetical protein